MAPIGRVLKKEEEAQKGARSGPALGICVATVLFSSLIGTTGGRWLDFWARWPLKGDCEFATSLVMNR